MAEAGPQDCMALCWRLWIKKEVPPTLHSPVLPLAQGIVQHCPKVGGECPFLDQGSFCRLPIRAPVRALLKGLGWDSLTSGPLLSLSESDFPPVFLPIQCFQRSGITHCLLLLQRAQCMEAATGLSFF